MDMKRTSRILNLRPTNSTMSLKTKNCKAKKSGTKGFKTKDLKTQIPDTQK